MADGVVLLKGRELLNKHDITMYRVAKDGGVNYSTIHRYVTDPESVKHMSLEVFYGFLMGLGVSIEEAADWRLGDVFEFIPNDESLEAK